MWNYQLYQGPWVTRAFHHLGAKTQPRSGHATGPWHGTAQPGQRVLAPMRPPHGSPARRVSASNLPITNESQNPPRGERLLRLPENEEWTRSWLLNHFKNTPWKTHRRRTCTHGAGSGAPGVTETTSLGKREGDVFHGRSCAYIKVE